MKVKDSFLSFRPFQTKQWGSYPVLGGHVAGGFHLAASLPLVVRHCVKEKCFSSIGLQLY
jgi:hypothetical protein